MPENRSKTFWVVYGYLILLVLLRLIPYLYPDARTWGFNHHIYLPDAIQIVFFIAAGMGLILPFWKGLPNLSENAIEGINRALFVSGRRYVYAGTIALIGMIVFFAFSQRVHLLGDGYFIIQNLSHQNPLLVKTSEFGVVHFYNLVAGAIGPPNKSTAEIAVRFISILSGGLYLLLVVKIADAVSENAVRRVFLLVSLILSGAILLFFGYAEYYAVIWVLAALYIWLGIRYINIGRGIIPIIAVFIFGLFLHFSFLLFLPSLPVILLSRGRLNRFYTAWKKAIIFGIVTVLTVLIALFYHEYSGNLYIQDIFLPLFHGKTSAPHYAIFSLAHLESIANEIVLVAPLLPLLLILAFRRIGKAVYDNSKFFILLSSVGPLIFLLVIDPKLSMARDWDLFSLCLLPVYLFSLIIQTDSNLKRLSLFIPSIILILASSTALYVITNVRTDTAQAYFESLIDMDMDKSLSSVTILSDYYRGIGEKKKADSMDMVYKANFPHNRLLASALNAISVGETEAAYKMYSQIKPDKFNADYHRLKANIYGLTGRRKDAIREINLALQLRPSAPVYYHDRARIYFAMHDMDAALADLYTGYRIAPKSNYFIDGLSYYYLVMRNYDSTLKYSRLWRMSDTTQPNSFFYMAKAFILKGDREKAELYYDSLVLFPRNDTLINLKRNEILNMLKNK